MPVAADFTTAAIVPKRWRAKIIAQTPAQIQQIGKLSPGLLRLGRDVRKIA